MKKGIILVLTGVSSVGKHNIRELLMKDRQLKLLYSISLTTRPMREHEVDGRDYYFVNYETFANAVRQKELLEFTEFEGYYYGTLLNPVEFLVNSGKNVLIEVEAQGVGQVKLNYPEALCVFIYPESIEDLQQQICTRYKDDLASAQRRISKAKVELELADLFHHKVTNSNSLKSYEEIRELLLTALEEQNG